MLTTGIVWLVLAGAVMLLALSLGARSSRTLRWMQASAVTLTVAAGLIGLLFWGIPQGEITGVTSDVGLMMFAAAGLGILTLMIVTGRTRQGNRATCQTVEGEAVLWRAAMRAVTESPTLNQMLLGVASALRNATGAASAIVYKYDARDDKSVLVGTALSDVSTGAQKHAGQTEESIARQNMAEGHVAVYTLTAESRRSRSPRYWIGIPMQTGGRFLGTVLLSQPTADTESETTSRLLGSVGMLAARAMSDWAEASFGAASRCCTENLNALSLALMNEHSFERALPLIARALDGLVDADYLSVAWLDRAHFHEDRASMIIGEQRIVENRRRWPIWDGTTSRLLLMKRPLITPDLACSGDDTDAEAAWENRLGLRSRIVVPIHDTERLLGSITLAHRKVARYGEDESVPLAALATVVGAWMKRLEAERQAERSHEAVCLANEWDRDPFLRQSDTELLHEAQRAIRTSALRLYRISADGLSLEMLGSAGRAARNLAPATRILLADAPWHRWSMTDRAPRRIDQSDPESIMEKGELERAMIPRMKTGWIVPIVSGDRIMGFIDAMETRDPDRHTVSEPECLLLAAIARTFARRWLRTESTVAGDAFAQEWPKRMSSFNNTIINPLTGIIGSVELIRHKQPGLTEETLKYLNTVERCAGRIHTSALESLGPRPCESGIDGSDPKDLIGRRYTVAQAALPIADSVSRQHSSRLGDERKAQLLVV